MPDPATNKAMAALDTMAEVWAAKFQAAGKNLRGAVRAMLICPDAADRVLQLVKQAHAEGLFEGFHAGKNFRRPSGRQASAEPSSADPAQLLAKQARDAYEREFQADSSDPSHAERLDTFLRGYIASSVKAVAPPPDPGAMWDRFIAHLNELDGIEHVSLLGSVAKYRQAFIDADRIGASLELELASRGMEVVGGAGEPSAPSSRVMAGGDPVPARPSGVGPSQGQSKPTRSELLAMFGADYTSDSDVAAKAGCCVVCFDPRECVDGMQCKANLSPLTKIAPDPTDESGVKGLADAP